MSRSRNLLISIAAAVLAGLLVYGVYLVQVRQIRLQETTQVVVPKQFIRAGVLLTEEMLEWKPVFDGSVLPGTAQRMEDVIGRETVVPLGSQEPVLAWKLDKFHLLPGQNQATFQVPKEYILSVSNGIRAGDSVKVYLSGKDGSRRLFDHDVIVASVKSAANVEVDDPKNPSLLSRLDGDAERMYASRREANGSIDQINLNLTEREWLELDEACRAKQAKLVIAFASSSLAASP
ncbi:hypothetical protein J31TS4_44310 [Paenibacillus sp. J31TS4]|uniref:SAF domain-containing protein n=1 Tax=Paenibacillus sp. J31TS4 TaxID=2807195 RepID=UPI001B26DEB8|nr:SAF domain-containing protein [Paenibacillus sp. J31TS4]GIP41151.1 hypothetical protein J31TS4_44310 [Paenibacillus sp. J31TS4]